MAESLNWKKIYDKTASEFEKTQEKLERGELISRKEAAAIREKKLYDVVKKQEMVKRTSSLKESVKDEEKKMEQERMMPAKSMPEPADTNLIEPNLAEGESKRKEVVVSKLEEEREYPARAASWHTLHKLENYSDLNASTKEESDEKFLELTRKLWNELTIHGKTEYDPKTKEKSLRSESDLDGKSCIFLMKLAGIKTDKVNYVYQGEMAESGITMDTSNKHGIIAEEKGKRLIIDHHAPESDRFTSATKFVYEALVETGLLKRKEYLDKYVNFVTGCDNAAYTENEAKKIYANFSRNLYGSRNRLAPEQLLEFFRTGTDPMGSLSEEQLNNEKYFNPGSRNPDKMDSLKQLEYYLSGKLKLFENNIKLVENQGFVLDTGNDRFGKVLIDTNKKNDKGQWHAKLPAEVGHLGVRVKGYGGYLIWSPQNESFVLYTTRPMNDESMPGGLSQGINIRGNMIMKPMNKEPLTISLEEILSKLTGKADFQVAGNLKKAFEIDSKVNELADLLYQGNLTREVVSQAANDLGMEEKELADYVFMQNDKFFSNLEKSYKKLSKDKKTPEQMDLMKWEIMEKYQENIRNNNGHKTPDNLPVAPASGNVPSVPISPEPIPVSVSQPEELKTPEAPGRINWWEVKRETEVMAVEDLAGYMSKFEEHVKRLDVAEKDPNGRWIWKGGDKKLVFLGDVLGDYGKDGIEITNTIFDLADQAEKQGGRVDMICGNHDCMFIDFLCHSYTDKYVAEMAEDFYTLYSGVWELAQFDPESKEMFRKIEETKSYRDQLIKKMQEIEKEQAKSGNKEAEIEEIRKLIDETKGEMELSREKIKNEIGKLEDQLWEGGLTQAEKTKIDDVIREKREEVNKINAGDAVVNVLYKRTPLILENMRRDKKGRKILENLCRLKVATIYDDTLFCHADPSARIIAELLKGDNISHRVLEINDIFQRNIRKALFEEKKFDGDFEGLEDVFLGTSDRNYFVEEDILKENFDKLFAETASGLFANGMIKVGPDPEEKPEIVDIDKTLLKKYIAKWKGDNNIPGEYLEELHNLLQAMKEKDDNKSERARAVIINKMREEYTDIVRNSGINAIMHGHTPKTDRYYNRRSLLIASPHAPLGEDFTNRERGVVTIQKNGRVDFISKSFREKRP